MRSGSWDEVEFVDRLMTWTESRHPLVIFKLLTSYCMRCSHSGDECFGSSVSVSAAETAFAPAKVWHNFRATLAWLTTNQPITSHAGVSSSSSSFYSSFCTPPRFQLWTTECCTKCSSKFRLNNRLSLLRCIPLLLVSALSDPLPVGSR